MSIIASIPILKDEKIACSSPVVSISNTLHDTERKVEKINDKVHDMSVEIKMIKKNNRKRNWVKGNKITYKKGRIRQ